jgi:hypothetical protein
MDLQTRMRSFPWTTTPSGRAPMAARPARDPGRADSGSRAQQGPADDVSSRERERHARILAAARHLQEIAVAGTGDGSRPSRRSAAIKARHRRRNAARLMQAGRGGGNG